MDERGRRAGRKGGAVVALLLALLGVWLLLPGELEAERARTPGKRRAQGPIESAAASSGAASAVEAGQDLPRVPTAASSDTRTMGAPGPDARLRLRVLREGTPVAGATLAWRCAEPAARVDFTTDAAGEARVGLERGVWELLLDPALGTGLSVRAGLVVDPDERSGSEPGLRVLLGVACTVWINEGTLPIYWSPEVDSEVVQIELVGPVLLRGRVLGPGGIGVAAQVELLDEGPEWRAVPVAGSAVESRSDGGFELVVPRGMVSKQGWQVRAAAPGVGVAGGRPALEGERDAPEPFLPLELHLTPELRLEGRVLDDQGRPLRAEVTVETRPPGCDRALVQAVACDAEGRFACGGIAAGSGQFRSPGPGSAEVEVTVEHPGYGWFQREVAIFAGSRPLEVVLERRHTARLTGIVRGPDGAPLEACVQLYRGPTFDLHGDDGATGGAWSGPDGRFAFDAPPSRAWLLVRAEGHHLLALETPTPADGLEIRLLRAPPPLRIQFVRPDGSPLWCAAVGASEVRDPTARSPVLPGLRALAPGEALRLELLQGTTDGEGWLALTELPASSQVELTCQGSRFVVSGREEPLQLVVPDPSASQGHLVLRAVAAESGLALEEASIDLIALPSGAGASVIGCTLETTGPVVFLVRAPGRVPVPCEATLEPGRRIDLGDVPLARGGRLALDLVWPATPVGPIEVRWRATGSEWACREQLDPPPRPTGPVTLADGFPAAEVELELRRRTWSDEEEPLLFSTLRLRLEPGETRTLRVEVPGE